jgi:hypothetical protein
MIWLYLKSKWVKGNDVIPRHSPKLGTSQGDANTNAELLLRRWWWVFNKLLNQFLQFINLVGEITNHLWIVLNTAHEHVGWWITALGIISALFFVLKALFLCTLEWSMSQLEGNFALGTLWNWCSCIRVWKGLLPEEDVLGAKGWRGTLPPVLIRALFLNLSWLVTTPMLATMVLGVDSGILPSLLLRLHSQPLPSA